MDEHTSKAAIWAEAATPAEAAIWERHLSPGETLLWSTIASRKLRRAEIGRRRALAALLALACAVLAAAFGWKLYEALFTAHAQPDLGAAIGGPLYGLLALTFLAVFIAQLGRLNPKLTRAERYAATTHRLLAADAAGALTDEIDVQEIAGIILGGRRSAPDIFVLRSHDDMNVKTFAIEHIDKASVAKTFLEEHVLTQDAETQP